MKTISALTETSAKELGKKYPNVQRPSLKTLEKYGLSLNEWEEHLDSQNGVCAVCKKVSSTGRLVTDHEHVKNWKKLPPTQRKIYVRGLLCWVCNHYYLGRGITIERSMNVTSYLLTYGSRNGNP